MSTKAPLELRGERVLLRAFRPDELDLLVDLARRSTTRVGKLSVERVRLRIARSGRFIRGRLDLAIEAEGRLVGDVEARAPAAFMPPGVCEIGIELAEAARGQGHGTEALDLLSRHLLEHGFSRVQGSTAVDNQPMRRVFEKLGYTYEGTLRSFMPDGDGRTDYALYALTSHDLLER